MSRRLRMGPFNRVEGDLEVQLEIDAGRIQSARVNAPLFRGFEAMLAGRAGLDALVIVPRICGICSVAQSQAAALALASTTGLALPANGQRAQNLVLACENLADHLTHFYCFFMPDLARPCYASLPGHAALARRFRAQQGDALADYLPARAGWLRLLGTLAGKWPHTLALQPGGSTRAITATEKIRLAAVLREFRHFLETTYFGATLESFLELDSIATLQAWADGRTSDLARFVQSGFALGLDRIGGSQAAATFIAAGAYPGGAPRGEARHGPEDTTPLFAAGVFANNRLSAFDPGLIAEDISHSWLAGDATQASPPPQGSTVPDLERAGAYSWCKAPRYQGQVAETGALARQLVAGQPLCRALLAHAGHGSVLARILARGIEVATLLPAMEGWLAAIEPGAPFCADWTPATDPGPQTGIGLIEAARGILGHWLTLRQGKIAHYQIIAPTTWNFSPRDHLGQAGALEQALAGLPVDAAEHNPVSVQHVVRSFDPCMVCTVH